MSTLRKYRLSNLMWNPNWITNWRPVRLVK